MSSIKRYSPHLEICINCDSKQPLSEAVEAACNGGADRIELCSAMHLDGCTPTLEQISTARNAFKNIPGLIVMIRPRGGDFCYSESELLLMLQQIDMAADAGVDGIVFGALQENCELDIRSTIRLVEKAQSRNLQTTFHRAFDALKNPTAALPYLINLKIDRILTSGTPWRSSEPAPRGIEQIRQYIGIAANTIELVIGGGINQQNANEILASLCGISKYVSIHAYSSVLRNGTVSSTAIRELKGTCRKHA